MKNIFYACITCLLPVNVFEKQECKECYVASNQFLLDRETVVYE